MTHGARSLLVLGMGVGLCALSGSAAGAAGPETQEEGALRARLELVDRRPLPTALAGARDVRWKDAETLYLLDAHRGAVQVPGDLDGEPVVLIPRGSGPGESWAPHRLASSESFVAVGAQINAVTWLDVGEGRAYGPEFYAGIMDMDLDGDRVAILGTHRDREGRWIPDGAIVRWGPLASLPYDLEPVLFSHDGPKASNMTRCGLLPLGGVRFLGDGRLVVVPGVQPGVFLIDPEGEVAKAWDSGEIGIVSSCDVSWEEWNRLSRLEPRREWLTRRSTLDGLLPLGGEAGLIVRRPAPEAVRWDLVLLRREGPLESLRLPIESASPSAHLRADILGDRIVFLLYEGLWPGREPLQEPELLVFRWHDGR